MTDRRLDNLKHPVIPSEFSSRGTGETVPLDEAFILDFMPRLLGSRFMIDDSLRVRLHRETASGLFMFLEEAYQKLTEEHLKDGNLTEALEAYRVALQAATTFVKIMNRMGENALLNQDEMSRLNLDEYFGGIETKLMDAVLDEGTDLDFSMDDYADFVRAQSLLENRRFQINPYFVRNMDGDIVEVRTREGTPRFGEETMELFEDMGLFGDAAFMAKELGLTDEEARLKEMELAIQDDNPKSQAFIDRLYAEYNERHGDF